MDYKRYCCDLKCFKLKNIEVDGISCKLCYAHNHCRCDCKTYINSDLYSKNVLFILQRTIDGLHKRSLYINRIKKIKKCKNIITIINNILNDIENDDI